MKNKGIQITLALVCMILGLMLSVQFKTIKVINSTNLEKLRTEEFEKRLKVAMLAGLVPVQGKGIVITLNDSKLPKNQQNQIDENYFIIHDSDILMVINELRASGAEAISVNNHRVISTSEIRCAGPVLSINNSKTSAPFVIKAIGDPDMMESALRMRNGVVDSLELYGIEVNIKKEDNIFIPKYDGTINFKYAIPSKEGGS